MPQWRVGLSLKYIYIYDSDEDYHIVTDPDWCPEKEQDTGSNIPVELGSKWYVMLGVFNCQVCLVWCLATIYW